MAWKDKYSGIRGHALMTKELGEKVPPLGTNAELPDGNEAVAVVKLFSVYTGWRHYITEWDAETGLCYGLVDGNFAEVGYFDLTELAETKVFGIVPSTERDLDWTPQTLRYIRDNLLSE